MSNMASESDGPTQGLSEGSRDKVKRALQSAESLLSSLLDRSLLGVGVEREAFDGEGRGDESHVLSRDGSLVALGERSLLPSQLTALLSASHPTEVSSPRQTLQSFVLPSLPPPGDHETLEQRLTDSEHNLVVAAEMGLALLSRNELLEKDTARLSESLATAESQLAQLRHDLAVKDSMLQQWLQDAQEAQSEEPSLPAWVRALSEENAQLKTVNQQLWLEKVQLEQEAQQMLQKEKALVQQCFDQFSEAKLELSEIHSDMEERERELDQLRCERDEVVTEREQLCASQHQLREEREQLRERLSETQLALNQIAFETQELQERNEALCALVEETQEEVKILRELSAFNPGSCGGQHSQFSTDVEHESIVKEIEDALRKEIVAASTLPERPPSPNHYAHQRTMVVMETVRAATLATARRLERLAEAEKALQEKGDTHSGTAAGLPPPPPRSTSQTPSDAASNVSLPEEFSRYRQQSYFSPQKLQIVKPMEGSVTLLRWKLLATPQLGGASSYFTSSAHPGVLQKNYATPRPDSTIPSPPAPTQPERKWKSVSDLSCLGTEQRHPRNRRARASSSKPGIHQRDVMRQESVRKEQHLIPPTTSSSPSVLNQLKQRLWSVFSPNTSSGGKQNQNTSSANQRADEEGLGQLLVTQ